MKMSSALTYKLHKNKKSFIVRTEGGGKDHPYHEIIKAMDGKWSVRLLDGPGWSVPLSSEAKLKEFAESLEEKKSQLSTMEEGVIKSRKTQHKYRRAVSDSESENSNDEPQREPQREIQREPQRDKARNKMRDLKDDPRVHKSDRRVIEYCKKFSEDPGFSSQEEESEKSYESAGFPKSRVEPSNRKDDLHDIKQQLKHIKKAVRRMEQR